jgi:hypothetical protein
MHALELVLRATEFRQKLVCYAGSKSTGEGSGSQEGGKKLTLLVTSEYTRLLHLAGLSSEMLHETTSLNGPSEGGRKTTKREEII